MSENDKLAPSTDADRSIHDVPVEKPLTRRQRAWLFTLVAFKRIRFIAVLLAVGLFIGYWDTVKNHWDKWTRPQAAASRALGPDQEFYCPMDPQVTREGYEPNGDIPKCPICGMPLSIHTKGEKVDLPEGITGRVQLTPERVHLAGIKTVSLVARPMNRQTQTVGTITYDESRLSRVVSRVDGYVEKLYVDTTFAYVHEGDKLAEIYSPTLYATAKELLLAARTKVVGDMEQSARKKLRLLGVSDEEIGGILSSGEPASRLVIRSPRTGYVVDKKVVVGASIEPNMTLLEVADLSTVWVEADVYEKDVPFLKAGETVETTVAAYPNRTFTGKVALVYPRMETATRTNRIRFELDNVGQALRPGMYATVTIHTPLEPAAASAETNRVALAGYTSERPRGEYLVVPERAVVDTGKKKVVYVEREPGLFEGVEVELGPKSGDVFPVLNGLQPGDKVAAAGAFLIDAETRLNPAAAAMYFGATGAPKQDSRPPATMPSQRGASDNEPTDKPADAQPLRDRVTLSAEQRKNIEQLPDEADRQAALAQRVCPVTEKPLGSMGVPVKVTLRAQAVFLCCKGCVGKAKRNPDEMLEKLGLE